MENRSSRLYPISALIVATSLPVGFMSYLHPTAILRGEEHPWLFSLFFAYVAISIAAGLHIWLGMLCHLFKRKNVSSLVKLAWFLILVATIQYGAVAYYMLSFLGHGMAGRDRVATP